MKKHVLTPLRKGVKRFCGFRGQQRKQMSGFLTSRSKEGTDRHRQSKEASIAYTKRKQGSCLEKEIMQGTMPDARRRGRPRTAWMDDIMTWIGLSVEESIRMTEDRDKWRKYVHGVANFRIEDG